MLVEVLEVLIVFLSPTWEQNFGTFLSPLLQFYLLLYNLYPLIFTIYSLFSNLSRTLGDNLDIMEDKTVKQKINIVQEEIKKVWPLEQTATTKTKRREENNKLLYNSVCWMHKCSIFGTCLPVDESGKHWINMKNPVSDFFRQITRWCYWAQANVNSSNMDKSKHKKKKNFKCVLVSELESIGL